MRKTGSLIQGGFAIAGMLAMWAIGIALVVFVGKHLEVIYTWSLNIAELALLICIVVLGPLGLFRKTRAISGTGYFIASYVFGVNLFISGVIIVMESWGIVAVIIGLVFAGVGVVPVAFLASIVRRDWAAFWQLVFALFFTWGTRAFGIYLGAKSERDQAEYAVSTAADEIGVVEDPEDVSSKDSLF